MVRLVRGGGVPGAVRLVLMVVGVAVGVAGAVLVAALPVVLDARESIVAARLPTPADHDGEARFRLSESTQVWDGQRLGRVLLAGVGPDAPRPPGVARLPGPGEAVVSPALARRLPGDPALASVVPGRVVATIGPAGLLGPDELFAYVGVWPDEVDGLHSGIAWGSRDRFLLQPQQEGLTQGLALLVLPPVVIYLVVCSRLAAATRARRYAALRLLGLRRRQVLRLAAGEAALAGGVGAVLGIGLYVLAHPRLADSGVLGFRWYPHVAPLTPVRAGVVVALVVGLAALLGAVGLRRALTRPVAARSDVVEPRPRPLLVAPLAAGLGLIAFPLLVTPPEVDPTARLAMGDGMGWLVLGGVLLAVVGLLGGLRPLLVTAGGVLRHDWLPFVVRLAGRRMACAPTGTLRLLAGVALLVLVAGVGEGALRDLALRAGPTVVNYEVQVTGSPDEDPSVRQRIFALSAASRWTTQRSVTVAPAPGAPAPRTAADRIAQVGVNLVTARCADLRYVSGAVLADCVDGRVYRLLRPDMLRSDLDIPPGTPVPFRRADGTVEPIATPAEALVVPPDSLLADASGAALVHTAAEPRQGWNSDMLLTFLVPGDPEALAAFKAGVARISPSLPLYIPAENIELLETYRNQRGVLRAGVFVGFLLAVLATAIAAVDRAFERRREVVSLRVLGLRAAAVRRVQLLQLLVPLVLVLATGAVVGHLAGNAVLRLNDVHRPWHYGTFAVMAPLAVVAALVVLAAGSVLVGRRLRTEDLRRE
jgi:hypothetical protein